MFYQRWQSQKQESQSQAVVNSLVKPQSTKVNRKDKDSILPFESPSFQKVNIKYTSETQARCHEWQRQDADDRATRHIMRIQALEAGARDDTLEDTASRRYRSFVLISYPELLAAMAEAEASSVRNGYNSNGFRTRPAQLVKASKPKTMQEAIEFTTELMDEKTHAYAERQAEKKRRAQGHFRRNCPKLKNNDRGNQAGNDRALVKVYVVGNAGANPDNVIARTFILNNRYAYILFDTGADQSFVSTAFSS
ncbi:hypothetical protein Tco_0358984 [Tanacetum coccineum]